MKYGIRVAIIGVGNIGRILVQRLLIGCARPTHITVIDAHLERARSVAAEFNVQAASLTDEACCSADIILLSAPPKNIVEIVRQLAGSLHAGQLLVSFAAAVPLARIEAVTPPGVQVARVMPNAPSLVGRGFNPVAFSAGCDEEHQAELLEMLSCLGETLVVRDDQMNWCVGLSGAAMRSFLPVLEGMVRAGIEAGLTEMDARQAAAQVMRGTANMLTHTGLSFDEIKALTPMQTVDEAAVAQIFYEASLQAKTKIDALQQKLAGEDAQ